jgi:hypothetical protein
LLLRKPPKTLFSLATHEHQCSCGTSRESGLNQRKDVEMSLRQAQGRLCFPNFGKFVYQRALDRFPPYQRGLGGCLIQRGDLSQR